MDDATLVARLVDRHPAAARVVWDRYSRVVRGLLRRTVGPDHDVEDLVQETFLRLFDGVARLRDPSLLGSFVIGIAMRVARSELRRRKVRRILRLSDPTLLPDMADVPGDETAREALRDLYDILDSVSADTRILFVLRFVEGLELTDVARHLGVSLATVKRHLARAEDVVRSRIERKPALADYIARIREEERA